MAIRGCYGETRRPATLGTTLKAHLARIVWCKECAHRVEPDVAEQVECYGAGLTLIEWRGGSGVRQPAVDFVVSNGRRLIGRRGRVIAAS